MDDTDRANAPGLKEYFTDNLSIPSQNVQYRHGTPLSEFSDPSDSSSDISNPMKGRSSFQWDSFGGLLGGTWNIYFGNKTSRREVSFDEQGNVALVQWAESSDTTTSWRKETCPLKFFCAGQQANKPRYK